VCQYGVREAARRWGDARKALTLFRQAGETATERGLAQVTIDCLDANLAATEREATIEKLLALPFNHFLVLTGIIGRPAATGDTQPVTTTEIRALLDKDAYPDTFALGERAIRDVVTDLETMGLVATWIDERGPKRSRETDHGHG